jgi:MFS family permease
MSFKPKAFWPGVLGAFVCWYDWILFSICTAIVFKDVFFPEVSYLVPLMVFAAGYVARPLGGIIAGHIGDRVGRKPVLQWTLLITAFTTVAMGLLPNYADIGVTAAFALLALRVIQALSFGAELASTDVINYEFHKDSELRGTITSANAAVLPAAMVASSLAITLMFFDGPATFMDWGWRVPFLAGGVLFLIAWYVRNQALETPAFEAVLKTNKIERAPILTVAREHWRKVVLGTGVAQLGAVWDFAALLFGFAFLADKLNVDRDLLTQVELVLALVAIPLAIFYGWLGDKFNRLRLFNIAAVLSFLLIYPLITFLSLGDAWIPVIIGFVFMSIFTYAQVPAFVSEIFPTQVRTTGASLVLNLGAMFGGVTPLVCWWLYELNNNIWDISYWLVATGVYGIVSGLLMRKSYDPQAHAKT